MTRLRLMRVQTHSLARWFKGRANQSAVRCPLRIESELRTHRPDHEHHVRAVGLHVIGRVYHAAFDYHAEVGDVGGQATSPIVGSSSGNWSMTLVIQSSPSVASP